MSRLGLLCAAALVLLARPSFAQVQPLPAQAWNAGPYAAPPEAPWKADMQANPRYPILVSLSLNQNRFDGCSYVGRGSGHVFNPQGEDMQFTYRCGLTFSGQQTEFYARWLKPKRKLEILLEKPGTNETRTCRVSTAVVAPHP